MCGRVHVYMFDEKRLVLELIHLYVTCAHTHEHTYIALNIKAYTHTHIYSHTMAHTRTRELARVHTRTHRCTMSYIIICTHT